METTLPSKNRPSFQLAQQIRVGYPQLWELQAEPRPLGAQGPARCRHAHPFKLGLGFGFQAPDHSLCYLCHLLYFYNLPVQHGPPPMFLFFNGSHMEAAFFLLAHNADNAAGANIQCKNLSRVLLPLHGFHLPR